MNFSITSFVLPVWVKPVAIALAIAAWTGFWWFHGYKTGDENLTEYIGKQAQEAVRIAKAQSKVTTEVVTKYVRVRGATEVVTKTVEKEVTKYADQNTGACLDADWVRLHNAAAANRLSSTGLKPDAPGRATEAPK